MKPTLPWMKQAFATYNAKYFHNRLKTPNFSLDCPEGNWGFYYPDGTFNAITRKAKIFGPGTIYLNPDFSRDEKDLIGTLLHEMIHMFINTVLLKYPINAHGSDFQEFADFLNQDGWNISEANEKKITDTTDDTGDEEYANRTIQPSIFCIIEQPNDAQYKVWGFRAEYNQLNSYIQTARKTKNNGATVLNVYYCYSANMSKLPSSPRDLRGVGAQDYNTLLSRVSRIIGEQLSQDNFKLTQTITL